MIDDDKNKIPERQINRLESILNRILKKNKGSIKELEENSISARQINRFESIFNRISKKNGIHIDPEEKVISVRQFNSYLSVLNRILKQFKDFNKKDPNSFLTIKKIREAVTKCNDIPLNCEIELISHFRWECIRRNPDYKKDYNEWMRKSNTSFLKTIMTLGPEREKDPNSPFKDFTERNLPDLKELYEAFGKRWQCPPLNYNRTLSEIEAHDIIEKIFEPGGHKRLLFRINDEEFLSYKNRDMSVVRLNWLSKDELAYPYKMDGEKITIPDLITEFKKHVLIKDDSLKSLQNLSSFLSKFSNFESFKNQETATKYINERFCGVKTMNVTINLQCPREQIKYLIDEYVGMAQNFFGVVPKEFFFESDSNGSVILDSLIKKGVLKEVSSKAVCLKRNGDESISRPSEIQTRNFDGIWNILQQPQIKLNERKNFKKYFNCLMVYDLKREGIVEESDFENVFLNGDGSSIFNSLRENGYFEEDAGLDGYPKELTESLENDLKEKYPTDFRKIINILQKYYGKRKSFLDIGKETYFYEFHEDEFKGPMSAKGLLDELSKLDIHVLVGFDETERLNKLLKRNDLYKRFLEEAEYVEHNANYQGNDLIRSNRRILQRAFPTKCPIMDEIDDSSLERRARNHFTDAKEFILNEGYRNVR